MINKHFCPCCASTLLRHISSHRIYWFCGYCHQEMPVIENALDTKVTRHLGIRQVTRYQGVLSDRVILHEQLLRQTQLSELNKTPALR